MATMTRRCLRCYSKILSHSLSLQCCICDAVVHRECIPLTRDEYRSMSQVDSWICIDCTKSLFPFNHIDDDDIYNTEISEFYCDMPHFATVLNQNKVFSPFDLNDNENLPLFACDPDANYYNDIAINSFKDSNFYSADSFNETYKKHYNKGHAEFSLCQINIRSIPAHLSELDAFYSISVIHLVSLQ